MRKIRKQKLYSMLKIISVKLTKYQQSWMDEIQDVDWFDGSENKAIDEGNYEEYLADDVEKPEDENIPVPQQNQGIPQPPSYMDEIPTANENLGIPMDTKEVIYANPQELVSDGINNREIIGFAYTNRHGAYAGFRTVEPHYTFLARTTGNEILVSFDRDVNDIRAFIVGNIHPNGVKYQDVIFEPREEIIV
ncbi:hypothetical protein LCGC14_1080680 [marine sediment metagenome]|uniref:Uncharacterized protein n=1 Tax=marine sediment metagenome TaxID=412755 RepID=A0A0F9MK51_9ZZZZ